MRRDRDALLAASAANDIEGERGTVTRNAFQLVLGQVATTTLAILFNAVLARSLGVDDFGTYFLVATFSTFAYVLVDGGQQLFVIREVARQPERGSLLLGTALALRAVGAALVSAPMGLAAWALSYDPITCWYAVVFVLVSLPAFLAQSYGMVFRARDRMGLDAWVSVANKVVLLVFCSAALALGNGLSGVFVAQVAAGVFALAIAIRLYRRVAAERLRYSTDVAREILVGGGALFAASLASNIQPYIDVVILSKFSPADAVGWYGAAKNILGTMIAPALIVSTALFPRLARAAASGSAMKLEIQAALRPILWLGALATLGTFLFADAVVEIVYGQQFRPSGIILKVYAPGFFFLFVNVLFFNILFALGRAKTFSLVKIISLVIAIVVELFLVPVFQERTGNGGIGVVATFVASEFLVFAAAIFLLRQELIGTNLTVDIARAIGAAVLALLVFCLMPHLPFWVGAPVCVIVFSLGSIVLGLVRKSDIRHFRVLLKKK